MDNNKDKEIDYFIKNSYSYMYHLSSYRSSDKRWACIHRENYVDYFNNPKSITIGYGETPELAFENVKALEDE